MLRELRAGRKGGGRGGGGVVPLQGEMERECSNHSF